MHFLVTAGPTREHLDDVRFISNASSGRMGFAIARAAARAGHTVTLVSGPVSLAAPPGVKVVRVTSTEDMYRSAAAAFPRADCLIGAAAPVDFRPAKRAPGKQKKDGAPLTLKLAPTVDILATLGRKKGARIVIAFALEAQSPVRNALLKLKKKNADAIVLNRPSAMAAERTDVTIFTTQRDRIELPNASKERIGRLLVSLAVQLHEERAT